MNDEPPSVAILIETSNRYSRELLHGIRDFMRKHGSWAVHLTEHGRGDDPPRWLSRWKGHGIIARIAPRLSVVLGQKLAAQTVPILGAAAGAATNYAYTSYYQEMAHVHFSLRALSQKSGHSREALVERMKIATKNL